MFFQTALHGIVHATKVRAGHCDKDYCADAVDGVEGAHFYWPLHLDADISAALCYCDARRLLLDVWALAKTPAPYRHRALFFFVPAETAELKQQQGTDKRNCL